MSISFPLKRHEQRQYEKRMSKPYQLYVVIGKVPNASKRSHDKRLSHRSSSMHSNQSGRKDYLWFEQTMASTTSLFHRCFTANSGDQQLALECISNDIETTNQATNNELRQWLLILCGSLVFFMQAGFAMVCAGAVRKKNVMNTMLKNILDACGAAVAFACTGYAIAFGDNNRYGQSSFIGTTNFFLRGDVNDALFFFQYTFSATAATIVAGTLAERCKMVAYLLYSLILSGFIYPVVAHAVWNESGYFSATNENPAIGTGMLDFSGSGVIHCTGGFVALYATMVLGPRHGRFFDSDGKPLETPGLQNGHSVSMQLLGTMILWFGWYGFNPGSALLLDHGRTSTVAAHAALATTLSATTAAISALVISGYIAKRTQGKFHMDLVVAMNGLLSGLVAITAGCAFVEPWAAAVIGVFAGGFYLGASWVLIRFHIDDAVDAIPVHLANGLWGILAVGLFATPDDVAAVFIGDGENGDATYHHAGLFYTGDATLLAAQVVGALFIFGWTLLTMYPFFMYVNYHGLLRVSKTEEKVGLDGAEQPEAAPAD